mmetsp:Transcript_91875/g.162085  ORF Transcript_91875/g.162085 Transcript_91875/m.162085 type:complete len:1111 (+) Transcript_91875:69-3401(+)
MAAPPDLTDAPPTVTILEERPAVAQAVENNPFVYAERRPSTAQEGPPATTEEGHIAAAEEGLPAATEEGPPATTGDPFIDIDGLAAGTDRPYDGDEELPDGWQSTLDPASQRMYYFSNELGLVQWEQPTASEEGATRGGFDEDEERLLLRGDELVAADPLAGVGDPNEEYVMGMGKVPRAGPHIAMQVSQTHLGDEGAVLDDDDFEGEFPTQKAVRHSAADVKEFSEAILEEISPVIDAEHIPETQRILRQTVGWMARVKGQEIEVDYLAWYLKKQADENGNFHYLGRVTMYMIVFVVMVLLHEDMVGAGLLQRGIAKQIGNAAFEGIEETSGHKTLFDIDTKEDFWLFLKEVALPIFIPPLPADLADKTASEIHATSELSRIMRYNILIGGVHLTQRRFRERHCTEAWPALGPKKDDVNPILDGFMCHSAASGESMTDDCYGPMHASIRQPMDRERFPGGFCADHTSEGLFEWSIPDDDESRRLIIGKSKRSPLSKPSSIKWYTGLKEFDSDTFSVVFNVEDGGLPNAIRRLEWLQEHEWIDLQTQYVSIRVFLLNPEMSMYTHASIDNFFGHSGEIVSMIGMTTFRAEPYQIKSVVIADLVFAIFLGYNLIELYIKFFNALVKGHIGKWVRQSWNWVQVVIVHYGLAVMLTWGWLCVQMFGVKDEILRLDEDTCRVNATRTSETLMTMDPNMTFNSSLQADDPIYNHCMLDLHEVIYTYAGYLQLYRVMLAIYCIILVMRFFKVFLLQPRLAMVIVTLRESWEPMYHHLIVFLLNLCGFTVAAVLIFGRRNGDFATVPVAFNTCFRMLFGDFDYDNLSKVNPITVGLWFWSFTWVCALVLVNMSMAIIMDVYTDVKSRAGITHSMWLQLYLVIKLAFQARSWVSTTVVLRILKETFQKPFHGRSVCAKIDSEILVQVIPGMSKMQADFFIGGALEYKELEDGIDVTLVDACKIIGDIAFSLRKLTLALEALVEEMKAEREDILQAINIPPPPPLASEGESTIEEAGEPRPKPRVECRAFTRRAAELEIRLQRIAEFAEDFTCWQAYRGKEVHERVCKVEALLAECAQLVPGAKFQSIEDIPRLEEPPLPLLLGASRGTALGSAQGFEA